MALIKCPECGQEISDKAVTCPKCGCPTSEQKSVIVKKDYKATAKGFTVATIIAIIAVIIYSICTTDAELMAKAQYLTSGQGNYKTYAFIGHLFDFIIFGLLFLTVISWIIYFVNKPKGK